MIGTKVTNIRTEVIIDVRVEQSELLVIRYLNTVIFYRLLSDMTLKYINKQRTEVIIDVTVEQSELLVVHYLNTLIFYRFK